MQQGSKKPVIIAELSIHPIGVGTSVGRYVAAALDAIDGIKGLRYQVTPMSTILEAEALDTVLSAVTAAHQTLRKMGAMRISSTLRVDERLDKPRRMEDKVESVVAK